MFQKRDFILLGIIGIILGFIITQQFYLNKKINKTLQPENENNLALEVSELIKTNNKLKTEVKELSIQYDKLLKSSEDAKTANEAIEENLIKYKIILGTTDVIGEGVEITFDSKVNSMQLIDLINAIKNIGAEAIQVNNQRIILTSSISPGFFNPPVKVLVTGDKNLLYESLIRPGGILEQIGFGEVKKKDEITIKNAD